MKKLILYATSFMCVMGTMHASDDNSLVARAEPHAAAVNHPAAMHRNNPAAHPYANGYQRGYNNGAAVGTGVGGVGVPGGYGAGYYNGVAPLNGPTYVEPVIPQPMIVVPPQ